VSSNVGTGEEDEDQLKKELIRPSHSLDIAMAEFYVVAETGKATFQRHGNRDGTVPSPGTAESDGEIAAPLALEEREEKLEERLHMIKKDFGVGIVKDKGLDADIFAGERLKLGDKIGISQKPHIKQEIHIIRHSEFIPEGQ
jgi:hypothetical protein